jgi:tetraacyldisaccharide 4'-kinase
LRAPAFWWRESGFGAALLAPLAAAYGWAAAQRMQRRGISAGIPVVCVGNPTLGGAGKTPAALAIGRWLIEAGERPCFLSRGYGGRRAGPIVVDPQRHTAVEVGDEPLLLARVAPAIVARNRPLGAQTARVLGASVVVMDDGFQNPSLDKNFAVLVIDGQRGVGNGRVFPAGPLRAPLRPQLDRAQAAIVIGEVEGAAALAAKIEAHGIPLFRGRLEPHAAALAALAGSDALAFAGIADPEKFFRTLAAAGIRTRVKRSFPDHHRYRGSDAASLLAEADKRNLHLVTTEKDLVRMQGEREIATLAARAHALPVNLVLERETQFRSLLTAAISKRP